MVRAARIELALQAWEAHVLPIYYARIEEGRNESKGLTDGKPEFVLPAKDQGNKKRPPHRECR
jgi:hypothetical protein